MWRALQVCAAEDVRLAGFDFVLLAERARIQHQAVEAQRLQWAARVFTLAVRAAD
ncbi:MAG: hypothetical protein ABIV50_07545 [Opitutus sp.]